MEDKEDRMIETPQVLYSALRRNYYYGIGVYMGLNMLIQDWMGLEGYISFVREHWVNIHWVVGLMLCAGCIFFHIGLMARFDWLNTTKFTRRKENG